MVQIKNNITVNNVVKPVGVVKPVVKPMAQPVVTPVATQTVKPVAIKPVATQPVQPVQPVVQQTQPVQVQQVQVAQNTTESVEYIPSNILKTNTDYQKIAVQNEGVLLEDEIAPEELNNISDEKFLNRIRALKGNAVFCDVETDETKSAETLIGEGKLLGTRKKGKYVLSYDVLEDTLNKIFVEDIISVDINNYYNDVSAANPKLLGTYYNVYHKGRRVYDKISTKTYDFLKANGYIKAENIITVDVKTRIRFYGLKLQDITIDKYKHELAVKLKTANRFEGFSLNSDLENFEIKL